MCYYHITKILHRGCVGQVFHFLPKIDYLTASCGCKSQYLSDGAAVAVVQSVKKTFFCAV